MPKRPPNSRILRKKLADAEKDLGGPPLKHDLDPIEVEKLAALLCTMTEIAAHFNCSVTTLERGYADVIKKGRERGKESLRRMQWKSAVAGNVNMQIFLGKVYLKQRENIVAVDDEELADIMDTSRNPINNEESNIS